MLKLVGATGIAATVAGCVSEDPEDDPGNGNGNGNGNGAGDDREFVAPATQVYGTIDPAKQTDYTEAMATNNFYEPLITVDGETREPTESMAVEWDVEDDGVTWVFEIREGVPFHDGGEMTAEDVVYTLDRMMAIDQGYSSLWREVLEVGSAEVRDENTVAIELDFEYGPFVATLVQLFIVDSETVSENEEGDDWGEAYLSENVAGSGAYLLENWSSGEEMTYVQFEDYWQGWDDDQVARARTPVISEEGTITQMMQQGDAHMTSQFLSTDNYEEMAAMDGVWVPEEPQWQLFHMPMNAQREPLDDVHVRRAMVYAFNYQSAVDDIFRGGNVAAGPVPVGMPGHNDDIDPHEQDLEAAQAEIEESSYTVDEINEIGLEHYYITDDDVQRQIHLLFRQGLEEIGIELEGSAQTWATITDVAGSVDATPHFTNIFRTATVPTPDGHTYMMFHPDESGSYVAMTWNEDDELAGILEEARSTADEEDRLARYQDAQARIVDQAYSISVANPPYRIGISEDLEGWSYRGILSFDFNWYDLHWQ